MKSRYSARCPHCGDEIEVMMPNFTRNGAKVSRGVIPPPVINVFCSCRIPVVGVDLVYRGSE